jgi:hypothetical protein
MSKIYFSRSISRTMSADHPVGDPTGGAAYGEKNDPVSAIISVATMGGTYAAAGSFAAMTVMQGITFAGAALSLVGNVTGNKTLSKIGMVAGIAGGLGQLAGIQGPTLGQTFGGGAPAGGSGTAAGAMSSKSGSLSQSQAPGNVAAGGDLADEIAAQQKITQQNMAARKGNVSGGAGQGANSYAGNQLGTNTPVPADTSYLKAPSGMAPTDYSLTAGTSGIKPADGIGLSVGPSAGPQLNANQPGVWDTVKKGDLWQATKMAGSGAMDFVKDNPYAALAIGQTAQPIADYLSGKTDAEIDALEAQTGYADANALRLQEEIAKEKRRRENLNAGYAQVNTGINVNPAVIGQAQAGGLISGAMQPAA